MKRARLVAAIVTLVVLGAAAAVALRYTVFFDAEAYVDELRARMIATTPRHGPQATPEELGRFHKGEPPCAMAALAQQVTDAQATAARDALEEAGVLQALPDATSLLWSWSDEDERRRHGEISDEEALAWLRHEPGLNDRLVLYFNPGRVAATVRASAEASRAAMLARAAGEDAALTESQRAALRRVFEQHRAALSLPGTFLTLKLVHARIVERRLSAIAAAAREWRREHGTWPDSVAQLRDRVGEEALNDAARRPFALEQVGDRLRISSARHTPGLKGGSPEQSLEVEAEDVPEPP